ncbi:MAG: hypothetical protein R3E76_10185 [Planctomycetota bacterium]
MPFTGAFTTQNTQAAKWLVENAPVKIQIHGHWSWIGVDGGSYVYSRVPALADGVAADPCSPVNDASDLATPAQTLFLEYATRLQVCMADEDKFRAPNNPEAIELELAKIKLLYAYYAHLDLATGSSSTGGLPDLCSPSNILDLGGAALSFPCLESAFNLVTANNGRPTIIMSNSRSQESYRNLCWAAGIEPPSVPWRWYDPAKGWVSGAVTSFNGVPWLINDKMDIGDDPTQRRIYFMVVGDDSNPTPTRGVVGTRPADLMRNPFIKRVTNGVPDFDNSAVNMTRDVWLTMPAGLALGSQGALSILQNFDWVGSCVGG